MARSRESEDCLNAFVVGLVGAAEALKARRAEEARRKDEEAARVRALAINHYVTTGNHLGEGIGLPQPDGRISVVIPVNRNGRLDLADFACLRSRLDELPQDLKTSLALMRRAGPFDLWELSVSEAEIDLLSRELCRRPGPLGWGSPRDILIMIVEGPRTSGGDATVPLKLDRLR